MVTRYAQNYLFKFVTIYMYTFIPLFYHLARYILSYQFYFFFT